MAGSAAVWVCRICLFFIFLAGGEVAAGLDEVDAYDEDDDRRQHDVGAEALVAVADGDVAEAAAADCAGHGRGADEVDDEDRNVVDDRRQGFGNEDLADDLEGRGSHGFSCFDEAEVDVADRRFDETAQEGNGHDGQRYAGRRRADGRAGDDAGQRNDGDHEDDKGNRADDVDDGAQYLIDKAVFQNMAPAGRDQRNAEGNTDDGGDDRRDGDHENSFLNALEH